MDNRFVLNRRRAKVMGVCAGLSDSTGIDVLIVRLAVILAVFATGPVALLLYVLTGWLATDDR
jgi:phage shock protein C